MIKLMKASAGTGKTYNLAKTYLSLLFKKDESGRMDPYAYRHILAVTFTNKATDEMKSRILDELHILATNPTGSKYYSSFVPSVFPDAPSVSKQAGVVLSNLLHDYGAFAISTIDRFFQQTLKAFSREIGQMASYQIELDKDSLVRESVDRLLDSLSEETPELLQWLSDSVASQLEEGKRYNLETSLQDMGKRLKSEQRRTMIEHFGIDEDKAVSRASLKKTEDAVKKIIKDFRKEVCDSAKVVTDALASAGVDPKETNRGWLAAVLNFDGSRGWPDKMPSASFLSNAMDFDKWFKKADQSRYECYRNELSRPVKAFADLFQGEKMKAYNTAMMLRNQIHDMGIAADLFREFNALLKEKNELCLDESNTLLKNIIDGSDAPFIYEKTGVRFDHFLLDEFQDTSRVQWDNFRPLLEESNSRQNENLIVGDIKQSIYRWRGSDWNLMAKDVPEQFPDVKVETLGVNFRSLPNIVKFNHEFFSWISRALKLEDIYSDVSAEANKKGDGSVRVIKFDSNATDDAQLGAVVSEIRRIVEAGAAFSDIAVLVRNNDDGVEISSRLIQEGIPVISDESLKVKSSSIVRRITALMERSVKPEDKFARYVAEHLGVSEVPKDSLSLVDLAEGLARGLMKTYPDSFRNESSYLMAFMDQVVDYVKLNGNSLAGFLERWKTADPAIGSPAGADAVRIMTIHKSKGLEFPYVIFPHAEKVSLFKNTPLWSHPTEGAPLFKDLDDNVYDVTMGQSAANTYFSESYANEVELQKVDNINVFYVALTRAIQGMTIITSLPKTLTGNDFGQLLVNFLDEDGANIGFSEETENVYDMGSLDKNAFDKAVEDKDEDIKPIESDYSSFELGNRLRCGSAFEDFFDDKGNTGYSASGRLKGITMHEILASVIRPSDLEKAVSSKKKAGLLNDAEAEEVLALLKDRISSVQKLGWFPDDAALVSNEESLVSANGDVCRPDRVVYDGKDGVTIIDYKFGQPKPSHNKQVAEYASLFRQMGYKNVKTALWYVMEENIIFA
ncbi:MAG: UvrD-helicase domain-containing protein [Bacteroidales bacterium]|nr:UvrD-helicase domain-containing protein [Bacteroidales bacterium]